MVAARRNSRAREFLRGSRVCGAPPRPAGDVVSETVRMAILAQVRVRVHDAERAAAFFGSVFAWELRHAQRYTSRETTVLAGRVAGTAQSPAVQLVFSDDPGEPMVRLGFAISDTARASEHVEDLGGRIEHDDPSGTRCLDNEGTPLLLRAARDDQAGQPGPAGRGVLGVIFVFARDPERAAGFYQRFAGWTFEAIGRDRDILFVMDGPAVGIRAASKAPGGHSGTVTFHISVPDPEPVIEAISEHAGRVGPPAAAGMFTTRACRDDQGTPFSLWYQPSLDPLEQ
jgi:predicted enzyme related to lactoylglutathione lyase